jgi:uncharacterized lipoprotein
MLAACGQREINVDYSAEAGTGSDWYPIPVGQPRNVTNADRSVERPPVTIDDSLFESSASTRLEITESTDSFGNVSLEVNRGASLTWELLEEAVDQLGWPVEDRNRSRYRLELADADVARRNFFGRVAAFFSGERQRVFLILVPRVGSTGIAAEYPDDEVLSAQDNRLLMEEIRNALLDGSAQGGSQSTNQE